METSDEQFALRLPILANKAGELMSQNQVMSAMLSAAVAYDLARNPPSNVIGLVRDMADRLESDSEHGVTH